MQNEHPPFVLRDGELISWKENNLNLSGPTANYGVSCIDGMITTIKVINDRFYLVFPDFGAHLARHIFNGSRSVRNVDEEDIVSLDEAIRLGRLYESHPSLKFKLNQNQDLNFTTYMEKFVNLFIELIKKDFGYANYIRPIFVLSDSRMADDLPNDCAIDASLYKANYAVNPMYWPAILGPRHPAFSGYNVLIAQKYLAPAPDTSKIQFKAGSTYDPTRNPGVAEKNAFNCLFGSHSNGFIHDILLLDYTRTYLSEGSGSNIVIVEPNGTFISPLIDGTVFPGLTQRFVHNDLVQGEVGKTLGWNSAYRNISVDELAQLANRGCEMFLTGSAAGIIPIKRIYIPSIRKVKTTGDARLVEFKTGPDTLTALVRDCYQSFSIGEVCEINQNGKKVRMTSFEGVPLMIELPPQFAPKAFDKLTHFSPKFERVSVPLDQIMQSGRVTQIPSLHKNRIETINQRRTLTR